MIQILCRRPIYSLMYARTIALAKSEAFLISCCIVGKAGAPPHANNMVPNARAKLFRVTGLCSTFWGFSDIGVVHTAAIRTILANDVATVAPTARGLSTQHTRRYIYCLPNCSQLLWCTEIASSHLLPEQLVTSVNYHYINSCRTLCSDV